MGEWLKINGEAITQFIALEISMPMERRPLADYVPKVVITYWSWPPSLDSGYAVKGKPSCPTTKKKKPTYAIFPHIRITGKLLSKELPITNNTVVKAAGNRPTNLRGNFRSLSVIELCLQKMKRLMFLLLSLMILWVCKCQSENHLCWEYTKTNSYHYHQPALLFLYLGCFHCLTMLWTLPLFLHTAKWSEVSKEPFMLEKSATTTVQSFFQRTQLLACAARSEAVESFCWEVRMAAMNLECARWIVITGTTNQLAQLMRWLL